MNADGKMRPRRAGARDRLAPGVLAAPGHQRRRLDRHRHYFSHRRRLAEQRQVRPVLHRRYAGGAHRQPARLEPLPDVHERARAGDPAHRRSRAPRRTSASAARSRPASPSPTTSPASSPRSTISRRGRAAWNVVTSANDYAARNFGHAKLPPHALRYERASEFVDVVKALWDTWDDDAFIHDRASGLYFDPAQAARGPPQGQVLQGRRRAQHRPLAAGPSGDHPGRRVRHRLRTRRARPRKWCSPAPSNPQDAKSGYDDLKGRMAKYGRDPDTLKILAGLPVVIGGSAAGGRGQVPGAAGDDPSRRRPLPPRHRPGGGPVRPAARRADPGSGCPRAPISTRRSSTAS